VSATLLGEPDLGLLTPPEMARKAGQIVYSIPGVPVLVDADTGAWLFVFVSCLQL
jgi:2-methylisocitrate lyase-like PEP mutase family enzyme